MNTPEREERPFETAENPSDAHTRTLAELVEANAARKREQAGWVFGFDPNELEETPDDAA